MYQILVWKAEGWGSAVGRGGGEGDDSGLPERQLRIEAGLILWRGDG